MVTLTNSAGQYGNVNQLYGAVW